MQRLCVCRRGVGMIDALHDLPGRGRGPAGYRIGIAGAPVDRFDPQSVRGFADQLLERRAFQHAIDQLAPVVIGRGREIRCEGQVTGLRCHLGRRSWAPLFRAEIATGGPPSQTVVLVSFGHARSGNRSIPSVESCASAEATLRPAITRLGAISASGTSTKARSNRRGCGSVSSGFCIETSS
ncbi:hypothetical protein GALL_520010 [mine drainage metagenome]|uniref:Uncharacterized protein n=1 Tax=mine drainage metagenome TaxID=410659 RepID=A0A1J5PMB9_9ZZZZ